MSKKLIQKTDNTTSQYSEVTFNESRQIALAEELKAYQLLQMEHDKIYHSEIVVLGISRRMSHVVLHLIKYLDPLCSTPSTCSSNKKAFIDSFIMIISASNTLGIPLFFNLEIEETNNNGVGFISEYIQILAKLAKACEATDHQEDYPIRAVWNNNIKSFFCLLLNESKVRKINILEEAKNRLASVERTHPLEDILQVKE